MAFCGTNAKMLYGLNQFEEGLIEQKFGGIQMPICGYNAKMLFGTSQFEEGLVEHGMIDRSILKDKSLEEISANELSEMDEFLREMPNITDEAFRNIIMGAGMHAKGVYLLVTPDHVRRGNYRNILKKSSDVLYGMDNEYYSHLETQPNRMKKLVEWINNYVASKIE